MNKDKFNSDKIPMDDLFRDAFSDHKEPTDEKDFDQFLNQLEETGYFKKNRRRPFYFLLFVMLGGILTFSLLNWNNNNQKKRSTQSLVEKSSDTINDEVTSKDNTNIQVPVTEKEKKKYKSDKKLLSTEGSVEEKNNEILPTPASEIFQEKDLHTLKKDSIERLNVTPKKKSNKDSVRIHYVMQVDTIKTIDSLNIKKRKWDKMRKK